MNINGKMDCGQYEHIHSVELFIILQHYTKTVKQTALETNVWVDQSN